MSKGLLTKVNSQLGEIIEYYPNTKTTRHSVHFESEDLKDYWISRYLYNEANYDWKTELEVQPEFAFIQNTSTGGIFTIKVDYYKNNWGENITSLLNKDSAIIKGDDGNYYLYNLSNAVNEGEKNISYVATLNIAFSYQVLNLLINDIMINRTHAKTDFINLDNSKNNNNILQNFIKREMFDLTTREKIDNVNIPSIFLFYKPESEETQVSKNSLYKVKIIPICSGIYYPFSTAAPLSLNSTLDAINYIYNLKDPLLEYVMILPETPHITKNLKSDLNGNFYWNGELNYDNDYISYETLSENLYIFNLKVYVPFNYLFNGSYLFRTTLNNGDYSPKIIQFSSTLSDNVNYLLTYRIMGWCVSPFEFCRDMTVSYELNGSIFPNLGESKIIFLGGLNAPTTNNANLLNNGDFNNRVLYGLDKEFTLEKETEGIYIYPIKVSNIDNLNYKFENPEGKDLYDLYNENWYYYNYDDEGETKQSIIPNSNIPWGSNSITGVDSTYSIQEMVEYTTLKQATFTFNYRIDLKNYIKNEFDVHLFQSGVKNLKIGIPNTNFNIKVPINKLNNEFLYIVGILDLYKLTCNYFLLLDNYNINELESNFTIENVFLNGPTVSDNYLSWFNSNKTSRLLGRIESSILIVGGITGFFGSLINRARWGASPSLLGLGVAAGGAFKGLNMLANRGNLEHSPAKISTGDDLFINFIQPYVPQLSSFLPEDKITNFDFSLYSWEEVPENQYQNNKLNELKMNGIEVSNLVNNFKYFGEKKRYQYFEILETFENIQAPLSTEIKQKIDEMFAKGITFWYFRNDLVFNGIKNYQQENPFIEE